MQKLKPYPAYRDSEVPWLGEVPSGWDIRRGKTLFHKMQRAASDAEDVVTCFRDGVVTLRKNRRVRGFTEALKEIGYQGIRKGDLVIHAMDAFAGAVGVSDSDGKGSPVYSVCAPLEGSNTRYYAFLVREMARSQWILALAKGIRERSTDFRFEAFASQLLPQPDPADQLSIVRYLDYMDRRIQRYIRAKQKLIKLLEEQKQAIIHQAVTGQIDVRKGKPYPAYKSSGVEWLGDVPEHWELSRLVKFITLQRGFDITKAQQRDGSIPVVSSGGISSYHDTATGEGPGVIVGRKGTAGAVHYIETDYWAHDTTLWVSDFKGSRPRYVFYVLIELDLKRFDTGSANPTLNRNIIHPEPIAFPPPKEQTLIAVYLDAMLDANASAIDSAHRIILLLKEYRTRLISDVVTGKLDVREAAANLPDELEEELPDEEPGKDPEAEEGDEHVEDEAKP
jgi:type I restriction enzyme, S subunit